MLLNKYNNEQFNTKTEREIKMSKGAENIGSENNIDGKANSVVNLNNHETRIKLLSKALNQVNSVILGKEKEVKLLFASMLANGHVLLDDLPGMGKTTMARALAATLDLSFNRIQFTSDILPSDILGISVFHQENNSFRFHQGPVFTNVLLADEINRASPRTQSALLEAMAEHQVTIDGETRHLSEPFFVIATQNPVDLTGTFPLPDSQLDRFLVRIQMGYPDKMSEKKLLKEQSRQKQILELSSVLHANDVIKLQEDVLNVTVTDPIIDYIYSLLEYSRNHAAVKIGLSPRAGLALKQIAQSWALIEGRNFVLPSDVQTIFSFVAGHRIMAKNSGDDKNDLCTSIIEGVKAPI
jgi:MoxR-like ATPase